LVGAFLVLFSSCATSGGKTQASPLFLGGVAVELACACLLVRLFAAQSSGQPRAVLPWANPGGIAARPTHFGSAVGAQVSLP